NGHRWSWKAWRTLWYVSDPFRAVRSTADTYPRRLRGKHKFPIATDRIGNPEKARTIIRSEDQVPFPGKTLWHQAKAAHGSGNAHRIQWRGDRCGIRQQLSHFVHGIPRIE